MHDARTNALGRLVGSALLIAVLAVGCSSSHPSADPASASSTSAASGSPTSTAPTPTATVAPKAAAIALAHTFVDAAILPPGARPSNAHLPVLMRGPWETTGRAHLVVANRVWKVPEAPSAVVDYLQRHAPPSFSGRGGAGTLSSPTSRVQFVVDLPKGTPENISAQALQIGVTDDGAGSSLVNVVGGAQWTAPRPAAERVPVGDRVAVVSVFRPFLPGRPVVRRVVVTDAVRLGELARAFDQLRVAPPGQIQHCVMLTAKTVTYRVAFSTTEHATPDLVVSDAICSPLVVTVNGKRSADLSGSEPFGSALAHALGQSELSFG